MQAKIQAILVASGAMLLVVAVVVILSLSLNSQQAHTSLLLQYFKAYAAQDTTAVQRLITKDFTSNLPSLELKPKTYELYDLGIVDEHDSKTQRFILITPTDTGKIALVAEMHIQKIFLELRIRSIELLYQGKALKP